MDGRFEIYENLIYKSRWLGIAAALSIVLCVIPGIARLFFFLESVDESVESVGVSSVRRELFIQEVAFVIGILAIWRMVELARSKSNSYAWQLGSWWLLGLTLSYYIWLTEPANPNICDPNGICHQITDLPGSTNFVAIGGLLFLSLSFVRFLITFAITFSGNSIK